MGMNAAHTVNLALALSSPCGLRLETHHGLLSAPTASVESSDTVEVVPQEMGLEDLLPEDRETEMSEEVTQDIDISAMVCATVIR